MKYFTYILHDEVTLGQGLASRQTPSFLLCLNGVAVGILVQLEPSVTAIVTYGADFRNAVLGNRSVETLISAV